jgi:hypothetical protein
MKTKLIALLMLSLLTGAFQTAYADNGCDPTDVKVVISEKKIWFVADEMPVKCLCVKIKNSEDKVVLEKCLSSKTADWSLSVESLPKGEYTILMGKDKSIKFRK